MELSNDVNTMEIEFTVNVSQKKPIKASIIHLRFEKISHFFVEQKQRFKTMLLKQKGYVKVFSCSTHVVIILLTILKTGKVMDQHDECAYRARNLQAEITFFVVAQMHCVVTLVFFLIPVSFIMFLFYFWLNILFVWYDVQLIPFRIYLRQQLCRFEKDVGCLCKFRLVKMI